MAEKQTRREPKRQKTWWELMGERALQQLPPDAATFELAGTGRPIYTPSEQRPWWGPIFGQGMTALQMALQHGGGSGYTLPEERPLAKTRFGQIGQDIYNLPGDIIVQPAQRFWEWGMGPPSGRKGFGDWSGIETMAAGLAGGGKGGTAGAPQLSLGAAPLPGRTAFPSLAPLDYSKVDVLLEQARAKGKTPEELKRHRRASTLQGMSQAVMGLLGDQNIPISEKIFAAGLGAVAGRAKGEIGAREQEEEAEKEERRYALQRAGIESGRVEAEAERQFERDKLLHNYALEEARLSLDRAQASAPRIIDSGAETGVLRWMSMGPGGQWQVQSAPADDMSLGLMPGGRGNDALAMMSQRDMPPLLARQMLNRVKGLGLLGSVFAPETMQDAQDAAMKQIQGMVTLGSSAQSDSSLEST